jgi:uncharacterized protein YbjQ (UPF0145 family)
MSEIADRSKATGLDPEFLQELTHQAEQAGVSYDMLGGALETFVRGAGQASEGKGRMVAQLKALNPELLESIQLATTQEERIRLAADAIDGEADAARKAALATALFGNSGAKLVEVFNGGSAAMERMAREARNLGVVIDRELIAEAEELGDQLEIAQKIIDVNFKTALINIAPTLIWFAELMATVSGSVRRMSDAIKELEDRSTTTLEERLRELGLETLQLHNEKLSLPKQPENALADIPAQLNYNLSQGRAAEIAARQAEINAEEKRILDILAGRTPDEPEVPVLPPELPAGEGANKAIEEARALMERLRTAAEDYAATLAKLDGMQSAGLITQETHNRGVAEAALKLADAAKLTDDYAMAQTALDAALQRGIISETQYTDAVEAMTKRRLEASNEWVDGIQLGLNRIAERSGNLGDDIADSLVSGVDRFEDAWIGALETGEFKWNDLAKQILLDLARMSTKNLITGPLSNFLGGLFKPNALGDVYSGPGINAYSNKIVSQPTLFPFASGTGLMGEAGPEAIIPLRRGPDGRLGVGGGAGSMTVHFAPVTHIDGSNLSQDQLAYVLEQNNKQLLAQVVPTVRKAMKGGHFG